MARYSFSKLEDGEAVAFDPDHDVFLFDNAFVTPDSVSVLSRPASVVFCAQNRCVALLGVTIDRLNSRNVLFDGYDLSDPAASPLSALA